MSRVVFQFKIKGPTPEQVSVGTLAEILTRLEASLVALAKSGAVALPSDGPVLSLVDVGEGSDLLTLSIAAPAAPAMSVISGAIASGDYTPLPRESHVELFKLSEKVRSSGWGGEFLEALQAGIVGSEITPERGVEPVPEPALARGTATLLARCLRVGGATSPKAEIRTVQGGRVLHLDVTEALAKQLGKRLYEEVVLHGQALWELPDWTLRSFEIREIVDFERRTPAEVFRELRDASEGAWEDVDALEFVASQRGGDGR